MKTLVNSWEKLLQDSAGVIDFQGLELEDFQTALKAAGQTETTQGDVQDCLELDEGDPGFQCVTEDKISADVKASAMEEGSDNELEEPQEYTKETS